MKWCKVLVCVVLGAFIVTAGDAIPGIGHFHSVAGETHAAAADTIEKSKVKKKVKEPEKDPLDKIIKKKEKKGGPDRKTEESRYERISEEKPSFWASCLIDVLGSICSGMLSSALDGDDEESAPEVGLEEPIIGGDVVPEAPLESGPGTVGEDSPDRLPYTATVIPVSMDGTVVLLWDRPGGEAMQTALPDTLAHAAVLDTLVHATVLDTLAMGTEVSVIKISQIENVFWVKVVTVQEPRIIGWIRERETSPIEVPDTRK